MVEACKGLKNKSVNEKDDSKMTAGVNEIMFFQRTEYDQGENILLLC